MRRRENLEAFVNRFTEQKTHHILIINGLIYVDIWF